MQISLEGEFRTISDIGCFEAEVGEVNLANWIAHHCAVALGGHPAPRRDNFGPLIYEYGNVKITLTIETKEEKNGQ